MNISASTLIVVAATVAAIAFVVLSPTWNRTRSTRRLAIVDALLATSYFDPGPALPLGEPGDPIPGSSDRNGAPPEQTTARTARPHGHDRPNGLLDPAAFEEILAHEDAREDRYRRPTTVVLMELDGLDRLVERLGPDAGERVEPEIADTISRLARRADYVARFAPGRFAVLMPETDEIAAINFVERIRQACEEWLESGAIAMRLSIGWASTSGRASVTTAMQVAADRMHLESRNHARLGPDPGPGDGQAA